MRANLYINAKSHIDEILDIPDPSITPKLKEFIRSLHFSENFYDKINTYKMVTSLKSLLWLPPPSEIHTFQQKNIFKILWAERDNYKIIYVYCI